MDEKVPKGGKIKYLNLKKKYEKLKKKYIKHLSFLKYVYKSAKNWKLNVISLKCKKVPEIQKSTKNVKKH